MTTGSATYDEYDSPSDLAAALRAAYDAAVRDYRPDTRVFVLAGVRLPVNGSSGRTVTLPDGTVLAITNPPEEKDDFLLSAADRAATGGSAN